MKIERVLWVVYFVILFLGLLGAKTIENELQLEIQRLENRNKTLNKTVIFNENEKEGLLAYIQAIEDENKQLRTIRAKLTAYSPLDNVDGQQAEGNPAKTSIGKKVSRGVVAADPLKLPYGTRLKIPDWGEVEVGDTGGALRRDNKNIRIDLYHETYKEAMSFGVKDTEVEILEWGGSTD